jgi:hypothetical protein
VSSNLVNDLLNSLQYLVVGILLLVVILWRPEGLIPEKPTYAIPKSKLKEIAGRVTGDPPPKEKG